MNIRPIGVIRGLFLLRVDRPRIKTDSNGSMHLIDGAAHVKSPSEDNEVTLNLLRGVLRLLPVLPLILTAFATTAHGQFISSDSYTRYELLAPETHQFRIYYEVTETRPGAKFHFNPIREGSVATDESVLDAATEAPKELPWRARFP